MLLESLLNNSLFWLSLAFLIFFALIWKVVSRAVLKILDSRSEDIKDKLDQALETKEKAQELLASYEEKQKEAEIRAKKIISFAEEEAKNIALEAKKDIAKKMKRRKEYIQKNFSIYEKEFLEGIYMNSVTLAIKNFKDIINSEASDKDLEKLLNDSISDITKYIKNKV